MAGEIGAAFITIAPSMRGFGRQVDREVGKAGDDASGTFTRRFGSRIRRQGQSVGRSFGKAFAVGATAVAAGTALAGAFLRDAVGEAREAQKVGAITNQIIKATGGAAKITAKQVDNLASRLSAKAGVDDEAIASGANLLLTFKNVRNEVGKGNKIFNRATAAAVDLSAAGFGSIEGASKMLGKALNDPVKGISALGRAGVTFTQQQKDQIKTLVASGRTLEAQRMIMREIESQVGGTAAASATAGEKMAVAWGNFKELIGAAVLPLVDRFAKFMTARFIPMASRIVEQFQSGRGAGAAFARSLGTVRDVVRETAGFLKKLLGPAVQRVTDFMKKNPAVVKAFAVTLGILAGAVGLVTLATTAFSIALNSTGIPLVIIGIAALAAGLVYAYKNSEQFRAVVQSIGAALRQFAGFLRAEVVPVVVDLAAKVRTQLQPVWTALVQFFRGSVLPVAQQVVAKFREWQPAIQRVVSVVTMLVAKWLNFSASVAGKVLPVVIKFAGWLLRTLVPIMLRNIDIAGRFIGRLVAFGAALVAAGQKVVDFARKVGTQVGKIVTWFAGLPGRAKAALGDVSGLLLDAGRSIISGLWDGLKEKWKDVENWFGEVTDIIPKKKGPPAKDRKLLHGAGRLIMEGLLDGLRSGQRPLERLLSKVTDNLGSFIKRHKVDKKLAAQMRGAVQVAAKAANNLRDLKKSRDETARSFASGFAGEFSLSSLIGEDTKNEFGIVTKKATAADAVKAARAVVNRMKAFVKKISALIKSGMPLPLVQEVAGMGSADGTRIADLLLGASKSDRASLKTDYASFNEQAGRIGDILANAEYGGPIDKAEADVARALERGLAKLGLNVKVVVDGKTTLEIYRRGKKRHDDRK